MDSIVQDERGDGIESSDYVGEMRRSYLDYAMSVIVSRALPDARDGLKPVHRRILFGMNGDYTAGKPYKKSARIVGDVMGKFHPHGDAAIYDAFVRMAQEWKMRYPFVDGQGNFGSMDGDPAAAMRYTEARMTRLAMEMTADIGKRTVPFGPNYDDKEEEPLVLPARFPNLLVNGQSGIAVGMATNIPTHNLREVIDAAKLLMVNPEASLEEIMAVMPGPDFPTRGVIMGRSGIRQAFETGRGSIVVSGVAAIEPMSRGRSKIVISELPFDVNKEALVKNVAELVRSTAKDKDKKTGASEVELERGRIFGGISEIRDESDLEADVRVVIDLKAEADPVLVLNGLKRFTALQTSFPCNMTCLSGSGKPEVMGVRQMILEWVVFRRDCVRKRTSFELDKARDSQVKQIGLYAASNAIDEVVALIRAAPGTDEARVALMAHEFEASEELMGFIAEADPDAEVTSRFHLNEVQADTILALPLRSLTRLEREKSANELRELAAEIKGLLAIMNDPARLDGIIVDELDKIREVYGDDRRTRIETTEADEIDDESLIERRDVVVSLTRGGYVKRTELSAYRSQRRGGKGKNGMETKDDDFVINSIACTTKTPLLVFTAKGQVYSLKAYRLPDAPANAKGRFIGNFIDIADDRVISMVPLPEDRSEVEDKHIVFVTSAGTIRRNGAKDFLDINRRGKIAMKLDEEGVSLVAVLIATEADDVLVATSMGMTIRFPVTDVRVFQSRDSMGVRALSLKDRDSVVDAVILVHTEAHRFERDVYLAGGLCYYREKADLLNDRGERVEVPPTVTLTPAPEEGREDRFEAVLSVVRMEELRRDERFLLTVTANGFGKRSSTHDYRITGRGGSGVRGATINDTTGPLVACLLANDSDGLVLITDGGQTIRTTAADISIHGRDTRGVRLLSVPDGQRIAAVAKVPNDDTEEEAVASLTDAKADAIIDGNAQ